MGSDHISEKLNCRLKNDDLLITVYEGQFDEK